MPKQNIFIVAGNGQQASEFKSKHKLNDAKYISSFTNLYGYNNGTVYLVGTWYERKDANNIYNHITNYNCRSFTMVRESEMRNG